MWEALLTFFFTFILLIFAYGADRYKALQEEDNKVAEQEENIALANAAATQFKFKEIVSELVKEKQSGNANASEEEIQKRKEMKQFLKKSFGTDNIEQVDQDQLKKVLGDADAPLLSRMKYRKNATSTLIGAKKKVEIEKGQKLTLQHAMVEGIQDKSQLSETFGFKCLHYSVSEASGHIDVVV